MYVQVWRAFGMPTSHILANLFKMPRYPSENQFCSSVVGVVEAEGMLVLSLNPCEVRCLFLTYPRRSVWLYYAKRICVTIVLVYTR